MVSPIPKPEKRQKTPKPLQSRTPLKAKTPLKPGTKRMKQVGKRALAYNEWRDTVAKPYLDATYGRTCTWCSETANLDVDHIQTRGAHPELKMVLSNVRYLCRSCHRTRQ